MARGGQASQEQTPTDWVTRAADDAIRHAGRPTAPAPGPVITCASGRQPVRARSTSATCASSSPCTSSPRRSGAAGSPCATCTAGTTTTGSARCPAGVDPSWAEHIGRPLSAVPDPWGCHDSWAEHFKAPLQAALAEMGVEMEEVSQTERYRAGAYREQILTAVRRRDDIERVLARYRTKKAAPAPESEQEAAALEDSVADEDETGGRRRQRRRPGPVPLQALLPRVRPRHHRRHGVRRRDDRPVLHLHRVRVRRRHQPGHPAARASWSGRSTGRCAGRSRASTSSPAASTTPPPARRTPSARSW